MKKKSYTEKNNLSDAQEPMAEYKRTFSAPLEKIPFMSKKKALESGMILEESRMLIMNKIQRDFAK